MVTTWQSFQVQVQDLLNIYIIGSRNVQVLGVFLKRNRSERFPGNLPKLEFKHFTLPQHLSSPPGLIGFVLLHLQFYMYVLQIIVCPFVLFLLAIVLSVLLRFTDSDYPFGIFKLFLKSKCSMSKFLLQKLIVARYFSRQKDLRAFQDHTGSRKAYVLHYRRFRNNNKRPESFPGYLSKIQFKYFQSNCSMLQLLFFCLQVARYFTRKLSESLPGQLLYFQLQICMFATLQAL